MRKKLTNTAVEAYTGEDSDQQNPVLWDADIKGLGVRYAKRSGVRTYILTFRTRGQKNAQTISIGRHNDPYRVDQARAKALELKAQMINGVDPVAERKAAVVQAEARKELDRAQSITLREAVASYLENKRTKHGPLRPKTKESIKGNVERYLSDWLNKPMATTITREACITRFAKIPAAKLTSDYLRAICNYVSKLTAAEDGTPRIFIANPVKLANDVRKVTGHKPRTGRIPRDRIGHVWNALRTRAQDGVKDVERAAADWLSFTLLTGLRLTESGALLKANVNLEAKTFHIPGEVDTVPGFHGAKNHNGLTLPLPTVLVEILTTLLTEPELDTPAARRRKRERAEPYVFASFGTKRPYLTDPRATLALISEVAGKRITTHDLRRTFEDVMRFAKVDPDERRLITNHRGEDVHQVSYANDNDPESLRASMQAAADWVLQQASIAAGENVIMISPERWNKDHVASRG